MKKFLSALVLALALFGCAETSPYTGAVASKPFMQVSYLRHVMHTEGMFSMQYVETITTADVTNPTTHPIHVVLDCTESRTSLDIPARTTTHVLLDRKDAACELQ